MKKIPDEDKNPIIGVIDNWPEKLRARVNDRALMKLRRSMEIEIGSKTFTTWAASDAALKSFGTYAEQHAFDILPADPNQLKAYLRYLRKNGRKIATLEAYVAHLREIHMLAGFSDDKNPLNSRIVVSELEAQRKNNLETQKQDIPIRLTGVDTEGELVLFKKLMASSYIVDDIPPTPDELLKLRLMERRDKMLLATAMSTGLRREEIAAVRWKDIVIPSPEALKVKHERPPQAFLKVPRAKNDQTGRGSIRYLSPLAVRLLKAWKSEYEPKGYPPFPRVTKHGSLSTSAIGGRTVALIFKRLTQAAGYEPFIENQVSGHSTRIGLAQEMAVDGKTLTQIMQAMDWKSPTIVMTYIRHLLVSDSGAKSTLDNLMA